MKGRSHRPQSVDPHEDWVDGSWTVDCVCGVNFDDGEEMVNCDECGVWVHTRCSKYVKGEELFACDKCKKKNNRCSSHNDSEETEVAQLLVELPTKTVRMETSYNGSARRSVKLWTDMPMENRVHVQGIPGGDPELFNGLSSVFSPQLWKCTGYVPKKFNFQYEEFPCWGKRRGGDREAEENDLENENPVDEGAGVLFSLSKESAVVTPVTNLVGMRGEEGQGGFEGKVCAKEMNLGTEGINFSRSQDGLKKERSLLQPVVLHSGKRKKEDLCTPKERSAKKKARSSDKEADERKRGVYASRTVFSPSSDAKQLQFYEDRDPDSSTADIQSIKIQNLGEHVNQEHVSKGHLLDVDVNQHKNNPATECALDASSYGISRHKFSNGMGLEEVTACNEVLAESKSSPVTDIIVSMSEPNDSRSIHVKQEGDSAVDDELVYKVEPSAKSNVKHQDMPCVATVVLESQNFKDLIGDMSQCSVPRNIEVKKEVDDSMKNSDTGDVRIQSKSNDRLSTVSKTNDVVSGSLQYTDQKAHDVERTSEVVDDCLSDKARKVNDGPQIKRELDGSERHAKVQKSISYSKNGPGLTKDQAKLEETGLNSQALSSQHKVVQCVGKSLLASDNIASKSSASDDLKHEDTQNSSLNRLRVISDSSISSWKDNAGSEVARVREKNEQLRKTVKEHSKSSLNYVSKVSPSSRISQATVSKRTISDLKDSVPFLSTKLSSVQNADVTSASGDTDKLMQSQCPLNSQNKVSSSGSTIKGERSYQSNFQPSSKGNHGSSGHPPVASNSTATLSDEELALLLHQELNSSPRVPRVPRVRHAGSLPQLASPTATNMLIKRTSSSGVKDHGLVPRRKHKDLFRDGSRTSREHDDEVRKMDRLTSASSDFRKQDMGYTVDAYANRDDNGIPIAVNSVKKNMPSVSTSTANSGPSSSTEANDQNVSSAQHSPRNISDDDTGMGGPVQRTLPGLINEIMSKGKRMTYEELCNAVLPHWPHLRKHNGERYAYSSHSQAVLDCLRNRHEWARLVDRGPKTNSSRKKRKPDTEDDSEDDGYGNGRTAKEVQCKSLESQKEEFPKGKRKARKRRRLALQGRGIKDLRKRRKSDDDVDLISNSSEESMFSEDEPHIGACRAASEASDSSDETRTS